MMRRKEYDEFNNNVLKSFAHGRPAPRKIYEIDPQKLAQKIKEKYSFKRTKCISNLDSKKKLQTQNIDDLI